MGARHFWGGHFWGGRKLRLLGRITCTLGRSPTEHVHRTVLDRSQLEDPRYRREVLADHAQLEAWRSRTPRPPQLRVQPSGE